MSLSDFKFAASVVGGLFGCAVLAAWAITAIWCWIRATRAGSYDDREVVKDFVEVSVWLMAVLSLCAALYVWGQS